MNKERVSIDRIKRLAIVALISDDYLMETLVLKGGNAMLMAYDLSSRASYDLDFSMSDDFKDIQEVKRVMEKNIFESFKADGLHTFDFTFTPKPRIARDETKDFWGGYQVQFKFIEEEKYVALGGESNLDSIRRNAVSITPNNSTKIEIEISKYEFVGDNQPVDINGYTVYVYAPRLLAFEKIRAICQQLPDYAQVIPSFSPRPRSRDFYDIYILLNKFEIGIDSVESKEILKKVFDAKRVPYDFLKKISSNKEIHQQDFASLRDTIDAAEKSNLKEFYFYFDYVVQTFQNYLEEA
jgi:predicted nucleotidyltransferase component of viral defense system